MATATTEQVLPEKFSYSSSIAADVWHPKHDARGYEWWYFDALSDDGREAIVVIFLDNFIFSPRYNKLIESRTASASVESGNPQSAIRRVFRRWFLFITRTASRFTARLTSFRPNSFSATRKLRLVDWAKTNSNLKPRLTVRAIF